MKPVKRLPSGVSVGALLAVLAVLATLGLSPPEASTQEAGTFLADRHQAKKMDCASCHKESPPKALVPTGVCLGCHGPYARLAEKTAKREHNPHASHEGDLSCESCHHAHKPSEDHCAKCHTFGMNVP